MNLSYQEKLVRIELLVTSIIAFFYLSSMWQMSATERADFTNIIQLLSGITITTIFFSAVFHGALSVYAGKKAQQEKDERELLIEMKGIKYSHWILQIGVIVAAIQYAIEHQFQSLFSAQLPPFAALHVLLIAFLLSEIVNYATQIILSRHGVE